MKDQILVPLKRRNQMEEVMPYLDKIAKPEMNVVFLIHSSCGNWPRMEAHLTAMHTGHSAALQNCEAILRFADERQKQLAEETLERFSQGLRRRGIQTQLKIYRGSLKRILRSSTRNGNVRLVVMPAAGPSPWVRLLQAVGSAFGPIRQAPHCSVLLLHPGQTFER
jgi:hypothetical protein